MLHIKVVYKLNRFDILSRDLPWCGIFVLSRISFQGVCKFFEEGSDINAHPFWVAHYVVHDWSLIWFMEYAHILSHTSWHVAIRPVKGSHLSSPTRSTGYLGLKASLVKPALATTFCSQSGSVVFWCKSNTLVKPSSVTAAKMVADNRDQAMSPTGLPNANDIIACTWFHMELREVNIRGGGRGKGGIWEFIRGYRSHPAF